MNKEKIVRSIYDKLSDIPRKRSLAAYQMPHLTEEHIQYIIDMFLHIIRKKAFIELVKFKGFGTFGTVKRKSKVGYDFNRKKSVVIEQKDVPFFRPCPKFFRGADDEM